MTRSTGLLFVLLVGLFKATVLVDAAAAAATTSSAVLRGAKSSAAGVPVVSHHATLTRPTPQRHLLATIGTFKALVLLVRFTDHADRELPTRDYFFDLCNNQIKSYLSEQSYGQYNIECDVRDWANTDNTEAYYAAGVANYQGADLSAAMFIPVLNQLDGGGTMDWSPYDANQDGYVDALLVIHSGYASEQGDGSSCGAAAQNDRIYSQGHSVSNAWSNANFATTVSAYAIASAFTRLCPGSWAKMGVTAHEWIHTLGTPDLYDLGTTTSGTGLGGIGMLDIMSNAWGPIGNAEPASMSAYTKLLTGWLVPKEITADGTYTINLLLNNADAYIIRQGFGTNEYLLIENRGNLNRDAGLPGAGLLIYHVDEMVAAQDTPGFPGQDGWPTNGQHYKVALLQADGKYDLEQRVNNGDAGDYWVSGMTLGPGSTGQYPNTDSYQGGNIQSTGITITDFSAAGDTMTFRVEGLGGGTAAAPSTPPPVAASVTTPSPTMGSVEVIMVDTPSTTPPPGTTATPTMGSGGGAAITEPPVTTPSPTATWVAPATTTPSPTAGIVGITLAPGTGTPTAVVVNETYAPTGAVLNGTFAPTIAAVILNETMAPTPGGSISCTTAPNSTNSTNDTAAVPLSNETAPMNAQARSFASATNLAATSVLAVGVTSLLWILGA
jgi:M6 family metalloprotease-like protein